jgi:hypothetical protein
MSRVIDAAIQFQAIRQAARESEQIAPEREHYDKILGIYSDRANPGSLWGLGARPNRNTGAQR